VSRKHGEEPASVRRAQTPENCHRTDDSRL
jgi:hypothetical protein